MNLLNLGNWFLDKLRRGNHGAGQPPTTPGQPQGLPLQIGWILGALLAVMRGIEGVESRFLGCARNDIGDTWGNDGLPVG